MEIHPLEYHRNSSNNNNNNNFCRSSSLNMHHQYHRGETVVATQIPHHHWGQPLCSNSNITPVNNSSNKKRDFHFQVIEVNQGPKWFIWPSTQKSTETQSDGPSKNSSNQENENHFHKNGAVSPNVVQPNAPMTINVAHLQRKNRFSRRKQLTDMHYCSVIDGEYAQCTATNSDAPLSEPTTRRMLTKPIICVTPSSTQQNSPDAAGCSSSMPSQTFKILSVSKKSWESDDEDNGDQICSCRKMSLSLDDDCELPSHAHCAAISGSSIGSYISTSSSASSASNRTSDDSGVGGSK